MPAQNVIKNRHFLRGEQLTGYLLLTPALLLLIGILFLPMVFNLVISLYDWSLTDDTQKFVGLENYKYMFTDETTVNSIWLTLKFTLISVIFELTLGLILALILNTSLYGVRLFRLLCLVPFMLSEVVAALGWKFMYHSEFGLLNYLLSILGFDPVQWLGSNYAFTSLLLVEIWQHTPFVTIILLAGLQSIPTELHEAAKVDGAGFWRTLKEVVLPLLKTHLLNALLFRTIFTMRAFTHPWVLTSGGPANKTLLLSINIQRTAFRYLDLSLSAAMSCVLFIISLIIAIFYIRFARQEGV